jgi:hypothetical protein
MEQLDFSMPSTSEKLKAKKAAPAEEVNPALDIYQKLHRAKQSAWVRLSRMLPIHI